MLIPWQQLEPDTLTALIEEFVLREGTDYGEVEVPFATKVDQVREQLKQKQVIVVWSELHETVSIVRADTYVDTPTD